MIDYSTKICKRNIQDEVFSKVKTNKIVTLGGPSIDNYVPYLKSKGFKEIISYETDPIVFFKQLQLANKFQGVQIKFGSILENISSYPGYFFDLDFCCTIKSVRNYLPLLQYISQYCLTFAIRNAGEQYTVDLFKSLTKEFNIEIRTYQDKGYQKMMNIIKY